MATSTRSRRQQQLSPQPAPSTAPPSGDPPTERTAAEAVTPLIHALLGDEPPVRVELWDHSAVGPTDAIGTIRVHTRNALRRILWAPGELGLARAHVSGDLDVEGDIVGMLAALSRVAPRDQHLGLRGSARSLMAALRVGAVGRPLPPPPEEARQHGRRHSKRRDADAISHHYDVGNDFYDIVLGPAMTYSCAYFDRPDATLAEAQAAKHELVCRKLGLHERHEPRLLDVGCGWGSMALHAAAHHGARAVGVTISKEQVERARTRGRPRGWPTASSSGSRTTGTSRARRSTASRRSACSSTSARSAWRSTSRRSVACSRPVVGCSTTPSRASVARGSGAVPSPVATCSPTASCSTWPTSSPRWRRPASRCATSTRCASTTPPPSATGWPTSSRTTTAPSSWSARRRARVWRLYMAASAVGFDDGGISLHQVLGVVPGPVGESGMAPTRDGWSTSAPR